MAWYDMAWHEDDDDDKFGSWRRRQQLFLAEATSVVSDARQNASWNYGTMAWYDMAWHDDDDDEDNQFGSWRRRQQLFLAEATPVVTEQRLVGDHSTTIVDEMQNPRPSPQSPKRSTLSRNPRSSPTMTMAMTIPTN